MTDAERDLQSTEASIRRDAQRIDALEAEKSELDPDDPRVASLSDQVERVAGGLEDKSVAERELSGEIRGAE
jgi:hypothetical protein